MQFQDLLNAEFGTLSDLLRWHARQQPEHPALTLDDRTIDYATLDREMDRVAAAAQRDGLALGDVVAISAKNSIAYVIAFLGSLRAGLGVALLAPDMTATNLAAMIADSGARRLFLDQGVGEVLQPVADRIAPVRIAIDGSAAGASFEEWLEPRGAQPRPVAVGPDATFNIIYSSGTTGMPKGIVMPHSFRWAQFQMFQALGYGPHTVAMVSIPLYSNMTLSSFLPPLAMGGHIVMMAKFDALRYLELSQKHRVTHSMMVPVQVQRILAHPEFDRFDLSSFQVKSCGSAPFPPHVKAEAMARWPGALVEYYGMTEGGGVCVLDTARYPDKLHTVGKPIAGHDMRVIDEQGQELPPGSTGEIVGRSPTMMIGYHNLPQKTREAEWFDADGRRFIRTGDVGRFDEDGFLVLMDRTKDMIISGGFNVYPSDLESILRTHPDVVDAAVTGVPSERWGETPVGFIVRRPGSMLDEPGLLAWSAPKLNKAQRLAAVVFMDDLPRNGIGKVPKRELRDAWTASGRAVP